MRFAYLKMCEFSYSGEEKNEWLKCKEMKRKSIVFSSSFDFRVLLANNLSGYHALSLECSLYSTTRLTCRGSLRRIDGNSRAKITVHQLSTSVTEGLGLSSRGLLGWGIDLPGRRAAPWVDSGCLC